MISKKKHFRNKLEVTQKKIWDLEFLLAQYRLMKEGFRVEYDKISEMLDGVETYEFLIRRFGVEEAREIMKDAELSYKKREEHNLGDPDKELNKEEQDILTSLQNEIKGKKDDMERLQRQMKDTDIMIEGDPEQPASVGTSVLQQIGNLKSVFDMLKGKV